MAGAQVLASFPKIIEIVAGGVVFLLFLFLLPLEYYTKILL